jgi:hypothetical protein
MPTIICRALLLAAGACVACAERNPSATDDTPGGDTPRETTPIETTPGGDTPGAGAGREGDSPYAFLRGNGVTEDEMPALWAGLPYESITLARGGCFGGCPVYEVTFARAVGIGPGSASYRGDAYVEREGSFEGTIDIWSYGQLCELFDHLGFLELDEDYAAVWTDDETIVLEATDAAGLHRVRDYGHQGPPELVALHLSVDATIERIEWQSTDD